MEGIDMSDIVTNTVKKVSPLGKLKNIILYILLLKWILQIISMLGKGLIGFLRISINSIHKLTSPEVGITLLFILVMSLLIGFSTGVILQEHFGLYDEIIKLIEGISNYTY
jgi:hypothetical protein